MDSTNGVYRAGDGPSSFFAQRGSANDGHPKLGVGSEPPRSGPGPPNQNDRMHEARRFEEEKRGIIGSLFGKQDEQGRPYQQYITHIKVMENAAYPSSPPPAEYSTPDNDKNRFIILSVKTPTGRVWMHKARQNTDNTFQIGKSWPMEELQAVEVFTPALARTAEEKELAERGGSLGFTITMAKPYYWRAEKLVEKNHFIQSLVRVYSKYSARAPELIGFPPKERERIISAIQASQSASPAIPQTRRDPQPAPLQIPDRSQQQQRRPSDQSAMNASTRSTSITLTSQQRPSSPLQQQRTQFDDGRLERPRPLSSGKGQDSRPGSSQLRQPPAQDMRFQQVPREEPLRSERLQNQPMQPTSRLTPKSSRSTFAESAQMAESDSATASRTDLAISKGDQVAAATAPTRSSPGTPLSLATAQRWRPEGAPPKVPNGVSEAIEHPRGSNETMGSPSSLGGRSGDSRQILPERRRPPLADSDSQRSIPSVHQPPSDNSRPSTAGKSMPGGAMNRMPGDFASPTTSSRDIEQEGVSPRERITSPSDFFDKLDIAARSQASAEPASLLAATMPDVAPPKFRPGLGPMMGMKTGDTTHKVGAALPAKGGFKPRAGGAGERLLRRAPSEDAEAIPKAFASRDSVDTVPDRASKAPTIDDLLDEASALVPEAQGFTKREPQVPAPIITQDLTSTPELGGDEKSPTTPRQGAARMPEPIKIKPRSNIVAKSLSAMDIDPYVLGGQELEYELILADFGWDQNLLQSKQVDSLQTSLRREIARLEAGSWLGHPEQKDERIAQVGSLIDKAITECDAMDSLLRLYSVELSTLNEDIAYIEAQSQGLQVQTANQKLLQTELQTMISSISIGPDQLEPLRRSPLQDPRGLAEIEDALLMLYQAFLTIDPSFIHGGTVTAALDDDPRRLTSMRALQEKKDLYLEEAQTFLMRLRNYADPTFGTAFQRIRDTIQRNKAPNESSLNLDIGAHDLGRSLLWQYSPLMLFAKTIDMAAWQDLILGYQAQARAIYQDELRDNVMQWKKVARKATLDEQEVLFTHQEKETPEESRLGNAARKLTVKRSQTIAKSWRTAAMDKRKALDKNQDSKLEPFESFAGALDECVPLIFAEQNFIVDFFHTSSIDSGDFDDVTRASRPSERFGTDLTVRKPPETDRIVTKRVLDAMEGVFTTWPSDMQGFVDWAIAADPFQGIGVLCALERKRLELEDSNQAFIMATLQRLTERLMSAFARFVDSQIRAIEEMKVKVNKRRGVHPVVRVFPNFTTLVENMMPPSDGTEQLELRTMIDEAYGRLSKAIFDGLKALAKETPSGPGYGTAADPEDKEALNYHIMLIENTYHFYNEVDERRDSVLAEWRGKAMLAMAEHQEHYVSAVIRRPLGRLLDFLESTEGAPASSPANSSNAQSRSTFKKVLGSYNAKDMQKGIETLRRRIEKHFGESDDYSGSQKLVSRITAECERKYLETLERTQKLSTEAYEGSVPVEFGREDITQAFRR